MTKDEALEKISKIESRARGEINDILIEYATASNPHKIGDIIKSRSVKIMIDKISFAKLGNLAECVYEGPQVTKKGTLCKSGERGRIYQSSIENFV